MGAPFRTFYRAPIRLIYVHSWLSAYIWFHLFVLLAGSLLSVIAAVHEGLPGRPGDLASHYRAVTEFQNIAQHAGIPVRDTEIAGALLRTPRQLPPQRASIPR